MCFSTENLIVKISVGRELFKFGEKSIKLNKKLIISQFCENIISGLSSRLGWTKSGHFRMNWKKTLWDSSTFLAWEQRSLKLNPFDETIDFG